MGNTRRQRRLPRAPPGRGRQALAKQQAARSCFTAATKKIDEEAGHVTALVDEVRSALTELWDELNGG